MTTTETTVDPEKGFMLVRRYMASGTTTMTPAQVAEHVREEVRLRGCASLEDYHRNHESTPDAKHATYRAIITHIMGPHILAAATKPEAKGDPAALFRELCVLLKAEPAHGKKVAAHLRAKTGKNLIPHFMGDKAIPDSDKVAFFTEVITAIKSGRMDSLSGEIGKGEKAAEPAPESRFDAAAAVAAPAPAPRIELKRDTILPEPEPPSAGGGDEDLEAVAKALLERARARKGVDEAAVRKVVDDSMSHVLKAMDTALDELAKRVPTAADINKVVTDSMSNGAFPEARVKAIVEDAIAKAAPSFDLDGVVKPRVDELLSLKLQDFLKRGAAAITEKPKKVESGELASFIPLPDPVYVVSKRHQDYLRHIYQLSRKAPQNILAVGPHGCGKTTLAEILASEFKMPMLVMDCANIREPRDWFGYKYTESGSVLWHRSQFDRCLEAGNHIIVLDELPRTTDMIRNTLFPLLDYRRKTYLEERGDYVRVGEGTIFFCTANIGMAYTGCTELDLALADRLCRRIEVDYLTIAVEAQVLEKRTGIDKRTAMHLAELAHEIRNKAVGMGATLTKSISTRLLIEAALDVKVMGSAGLEHTIIAQFSDEGGDQSERAKVKLMVQGKFGS